ncbi:lipid-binding SYLF domain-containing protein [Thiomicrorhabdus sp. ZW0627]|uniref:lipid-binding SYLF domain-containing protein n=1 Tax=Thiomicrorhabdus sp. ZW0627 TaxID=3039774 RepID=UPI0024365890|nr:lipid-binding SYLF domain-containing protein [Thiomicrorhabdus sp. ZW0627]MDG6773970.1 lipid-binding SYLF domain-containing protein [Thiomicrorhabdus sp. ZW0627]
MSKLINAILLSALAWLTIVPSAQADEYNDTVNRFHKANESKDFFKDAYGFAVFPTVGKAGFGIGGAYGQGRVYRGLKHVGNTSLTQLSIGFQLGGQAYSQIIFFKDKRAFDEFTSGSFEFSAQASAAIITAGASAEASTKGTSASAGLTQDSNKSEGQYYKGMATFIIIKGGLMYEVSLSGQKFSYTPK